MSQAVFSESRVGLGEEPQYVPLTGLAVAGLVLGVLSVFAFVTPALWTVAVLGAVVNLLALRQTTAGRRQGRALARWGLSLSLFCLAGAISRSELTDYLAARQGRRAAEAWLSAMLAGNTRLAHQLTLPPQQRVDSATYDEVYAAGTTPSQELEEFGRNPAARRLADLGQQFPNQCTFQWESFEPGLPWSLVPHDSMSYTYRITHPSADGETSYRLVLHAARETRLTPHVAGWQVRPPFQQPTE